MECNNCRYCENKGYINKIKLKKSHGKTTKETRMTKIIIIPTIFSKIFKRPNKSIKNKSRIIN